MGESVVRIRVDSVQRRCALVVTVALGACITVGIGSLEDDIVV